MKAYWGVRYSSTHSLTSALDGGEWSASRHNRFTPRERAPGTHWIGGWVGPRTVLDAVMKRKIPSPRRESKPRTPIVQPVAQRYTDWAITAPNLIILVVFLADKMEYIYRHIWVSTALFVKTYAMLYLKMRFTATVNVSNSFVPPG
jgi:hypothetical protein